MVDSSAVGRSTTEDLLVAEKLKISRRDFLGGAALSLAAGTALSPLELFAKSQSFYPPSLTGMRGSHVFPFSFAN